MSLSWQDADMVPFDKQDKNQANTDSYHPISLISCVGKLMVRMVNTPLVWHLEKDIIITLEQAGF